MTLQWWPVTEKLLPATGAAAWTLSATKHPLTSELRRRIPLTVYLIADACYQKN
jgi:hypothetical protein